MAPCPPSPSPQPGDGGGDADVVVNLESAAVKQDAPAAAAAAPAAEKTAAADEAAAAAAAKGSAGLAVTPRTALNAALFCAAAYFVNLAIDDVREDGRVSILHWAVLARSFSPYALLHLLALWLSCNLAVVVGGLGFRCWRHGRNNVFKTVSGGAVAVWNWAWLAAAVLLHVAMVVLPAWTVYLVDLPASATCALCFEQARLLMKSYSYLREHVRCALALPLPQPTSDGVGHLVYYLLAPTLIYQDSYERTARVRVAVVARHAAAFLVALLAMVVAAGRGALRPFCGGADAPLLDLAAFGLDDRPGALRFVVHFSLVVLRAVPAGLVLTVGTGIGLHTWHTVFAELLRFQGRHFTQAWWNAPCYELFFRDWNLFVKGWLYKYVYKEMLTLGYGQHAARMTTVAVSAFWHEYILAVALGYVIPFFAATYVCSAAFVFPNPLGFQRKTMGNLFVLTTLSGGTASLLAFYFMESTARLHCPRTMDSIADLFVPRSLGCAQPFGNCSFI